MGWVMAHGPVAAGDARERVLDAAERLFAERGYASVTLRDIAAEVGIRHTSLYHHVPGGKEELFVEVTERHLARHHEGLGRAIAGAGPGLRAQLHAVADWLLSQPPVDIVRMVYSDMPKIAPAQAERLSMAAFTLLLAPIDAVLRGAERRGEVAPHNLGLAAGGLLAMVESVYAIPEGVIAASGRSRREAAHELIDILLDGLYPRRGEGGGR